ncbi:hypothetical protein EA772_01400 [Pedobacter sp. G11]|uniref:PilN domain-containing protein n=1 Tax=Pedobacter sp. G11 TaxID=2482728 RepID=UPI000F5FE3BE|nr:PilN domain-containing protein [Pedobacter sp. G11]AZI24062.1 hypothetical protein EA772_01400 [Pedobacter sp. G11]
MDWNVFSRVLGVEVRFIDKGIYESRTVLLQRIKGQLEIKESREYQGNLVQVLERIPKQYPIALSVGGKGVVHKNTTGGTGLSNLQQFQIAFPAISEKEFYVQVFSEPSCGLISIARKVLLDDLLLKMKGSGLQVLSVNLGGIVTSHLWGHLKEDNHSISLDGHIITFDDSRQFTSYHYQGNLGMETSTDFKNEIGRPFELVAYASALQLLLQDDVERIEAQIDGAAKDYSGFVENAKLKTSAMFFLVFLFILLLGSYLFYTDYNLANAGLTQRAGNLIANQQERDQLLRSVGEHERFLAEVGWNGGYNYGLMMDEIGKSKPRQIWLTSLAFNDEKYIQTAGGANSSNVIIQGMTTNLVSVNNWIYLLKEIKWITAVRLLHYSENPQDENYLFSILIQYGNVTKTGI